jgi:hypothetical protein
LKCKYSVYVRAFVGIVFVLFHAHNI